ncbi:MAG: hypothetical protein JNM57_07375 [Cyclobacteriaceae bacterium]|nr:hypothetical protein [Cyclobacteriaceae bacterium]
MRFLKNLDYYCAMFSFFRKKGIEKFLTILTGLVFLNMSFFMAEVSALKLCKNQQMMENIIKLIAGSASEEETDIFGGSEKDNTADKEVDFSVEKIIIFDFTTLPFQLANKTCDGAKPITGNPETINPPPES